MEEVKNKGFKTYVEQLEILKERGLIINDEKWATQKLKAENYYNIINGYKDLFLINEKENMFNSNSTFEEIYSLYDFDRILRNILLRYILNVENTLRSLIAYTFSKEHGNDNYLKLSNFDTRSELKEKKDSTGNKIMVNQIQLIQKLIAGIQNDVASSIDKKNYINHYVVKYGYVPMWVLVNCISLGRLSKFYALMKQSERMQVASQWGIKENDLKQYVKILAHYRNLCAHDERMYNSNSENLHLNNTIYHEILEIPKDIKGNYVCGKNDLFSLIIVLKILLEEDDFNNLFNKVNGRLESLSKKLNSINITEIHKVMGLPPKWRQIKKALSPYR